MKKKEKTGKADWIPLLAAVLRGIVLLVMLPGLNRGDYADVYLCVLTLILFMLPELAEERLGLKLPGGLEAMLLLFIFASEILGELYGCYLRIGCWDAVLHTVSGFLFAAVGFALCPLLGKEADCAENVPTLYLAVSAVCFSVTVGVLWEFLEWGADAVFGLDMQKDTILSGISSVKLNPTGANQSRAVTGIRDTLVLMGDGSTRCLNQGGYLDIGLNDTMGDLLVNLLGAVAFALVYPRQDIARYFVPIMTNQKNSGEC